MQLISLEKRINKGGYKGYYFNDKGYYQFLIDQKYLYTRRIKSDKDTFSIDQFRSIVTSTSDNPTIFEKPQALGELTFEQVELIAKDHLPEA